MNNKNISKTFTFLLLSILLLTFTQCISNAPIQGEVGKSADTTPGRHPGGGIDIDIPVFDPDTGEAVKPPKTVEETLNQTQVAVGMRNHEQLLQTYSVLTGVSPTHATIIKSYNELKDSLPTDNEVKVFLAANQVAVLRLASEFCSLLVDNNVINNIATNRSVVWRQFDFNQRLSLFNKTQKQIIIDGIIESFWGGVLSSNEKASAEMKLLELMDQLSMGETDNSAGTRKVIKGACSAALASTYVTLI